MSEENEHTSEETEAEMNTGNHSKEQSKSEASILNNETGQPLLEDEEMPTYISVSSPSRREDSDINNTKQQDRIPVDEEHSRSPYPSDDQEAGSIYVLSSGEESNHAYNYEEDDEYADSEVMDESGLENEHENIILEDEEDEDEDDDEEVNPLRIHNDDDEDMDTEYEQECFDRASDDFILNNRLKQHHKERSLSLQDLSLSKNNFHSQINKKRHSLNIFRHNYLGIPETPMLYPTTNKKQMVPQKYQHVESKVKQYIKDIKEQSRRSMEKRVKGQDFMANTNHEETEYNDTEELKARITSKTIKDYAEKALNDLQQEEIEEDGNLIYSAAQIVENGENNKTSNKVIENQYKYIRKDTDIQNETCTQNCDDKFEKRNGSINANTHHTEYQNIVNRNTRFSNVNQSSLVNGHQQSPIFINLHSLSYEEYVQGHADNEKRDELAEQRQQKTNAGDMYNDAEMINAQDIDNSNASCPLKIENVKSIRIAQDESETLNFAKINSADRMNTENTEVIQLKSQLKQKDAKFLNLRDAYQKTLVENMKMKQELDALKKSLAKYEAEQKMCETKIASVQTEKVMEPALNRDVVTPKVTNKVSTSSVASTISSIDHWADSAGSPAISIKPPDLTPILNSDDSLVLTNGITPRKLAHPLSKTFITSSRILQTLSNITQGKTRVESPLARNVKKTLNENSTGHLINLDFNSPIHASSSKKRKATDMLGTSAFVQPSKIPHVIIESERKNSTDTSEVEFKYSEERNSSQTEKQENKSADNNVNGSTSMETKVEDTDDHEDSVKCFIYRDNENSKNRSFLIQAEEPAKDKSDTEKNRIQECGPYLLGNLEVRMSEINGTISVWGKEVNHQSSSDNENDMEMSIRSTDKKSCQLWQNTSQNRFDGSPLVCSTNKKQNIPLRLNRSNLSKCCQSLSLNSIKTRPLLDDVNGKRHMGTSFSSNTSVRSCENCDSPKYHKEWPACKGASTSREKLHSCCTHHTETINNECNCGAYHEREKCNASPKSCKEKFYSKGIRRSTCKNMSDSKNHLQESVLNATTELNDVICKYHTTCRCSLPNEVGDNSHSKYCNINRDVPCTCHSCSDNIHHHGISDKHTSKSNSNDCDEEPLIPLRRSSETLATRQRRLSGKRVRGILMDLLRGCGDCRSNSDTGLNKRGIQEKETPYTVNGPPQIKISPASTPEPMQCNDRCCRAYAQRIESQLEEFRMEMERVRSRSDAILEMLNVLRSVDTN